MQLRAIAIREWLCVSTQVLQDCGKRESARERIQDEEEILDRLDCEVTNVVYYKRFRKDACEDCGNNDPRVLCIHHADGNANNNEPSNLVTVCANHHRIRHSYINSTKLGLQRKASEMKERVRRSGRYAGRGRMREYSDRPSGRPKVMTVIDNIEQVMRYIDGMSLDRIAKTIGASKETVRRDMHACITNEMRN